MRVSTYQRKRAWIPDYDSGDEAIDLALSWIRKEASDQDPAPLLVTNTFNNGDGLRSARVFRERDRWITPRSDGGGAHFGPVVAFVPEVEAFTLAEQRSHKSLLCVIQSHWLPIDEWAAEVGAEDLTHPGRTAESKLDPDLKKALDSVDFFGGSNGWTGPDEKKHARRALEDFRGTGLLDPELIGGYMLAKGVGENGYKNITKLVEQLNR
jgi:hypothetical protein